MESDTRTWFAALARSQERLAALGAGLDGSALRAPSYAAEWSVADVFSHLGSGAEIFLLNLDAALAGTEPPAMSAFREIWDAWNAKRPEDQRSESLAADRTVLERLTSLSDKEITATTVPFIGQQISLGEYTALRLSEHAVHSWDIAVAADPAAVVSPDAVELLIDTLGRFVGFSAKPEGRVFAVTVTTDGPERTLMLSSDGERATLASVAADAATGDRITLPAEAFLRLVYGRLDPDHTPATIARAGDAPSLDELRTVFRGF